jgi:hypothetical protein
MKKIAKQNLDVSLTIIAFSLRKGLLEEALLNSYFL